MLCSGTYENVFMPFRKKYTKYQGASLYVDLQVQIYEVDTGVTTLTHTLAVMNESL